MSVTYSKAIPIQGYRITKALELYGKLPNGSLKFLFPQEPFHWQHRQSEDILKIGIYSDINLSSIVEQQRFWIDKPTIEWIPNVYPFSRWHGQTYNDWSPLGDVVSLIICFEFPYPKLWYHNYLQSPKWMDKRNEALKLSNYSCSKCGAKENLQVHHLNYNTIGDENQSDLFVCCKRCHNSFHN